LAISQRSRPADLSGERAGRQRQPAEIRVGSEWTIQEGPKVVGFGKVLKVIGSPT